MQFKLRKMKKNGIVLLKISFLTSSSFISLQYRVPERRNAIKPKVT